MEKVLELGAGGVAPRMWPDAEIHQTPEDGVAYDRLLAVHVLQCVPTPEVAETVQYYFDILRPGGELFIMVPDATWFAERVHREEDIDRFTMTGLFGDEKKPHRTALTMPMLRTALDYAGFFVREARTGPYVIHHGGNWVEARQLYARAVKPLSEEVVNAPE